MVLFTLFSIFYFMEGAMAALFDDVLATEFRSTVIFLVCSLSASSATLVSILNQ